jgi:hypothetical protein
MGSEWRSGTETVGSEAVREWSRRTETVAVKQLGSGALARRQWAVSEEVEQRQWAV